MNERMTCEERRTKILAGVRKIFASKGLDGATTRELAREAGVSEALLYKHYPSKEALYQAMLTSCGSEFDTELERIKALEPSTSTLILLIHFQVSRMIQSKKNPDMDILLRLYLRSLTEDAAFARVANKEKTAKFVPKAEECIKAAIAAGDIENSPVPPDLRAILGYRLAFIMMINFLPSTPVTDYGMTREKLTEHIVWFVLRGIGMKEEVIKRHYNPKALALMAA
jgi:AcrR family transcriptional regulator